MFASLWRSRRSFALVAFAVAGFLGFSGLTLMPAQGVSYVPPSETVTIETDCTGEVWLKANVGDTVVITMKHSGCNGDDADNGGNYANLNNLNGTFFTDAEYDVDGDSNTPEIAPYQGTATGAGYLEYVSHTQGTTKATDYWSDPSRGSQDDWYVLQTAAGGPDVSVTTTLRATDGNGEPLRAGVTLGDIYTEPVFYQPVEFPIRWAGPRDGSNVATAPALPDGQSLFAVGYGNSTAGEVNTADGTFSLFSNPVGAAAGGTEGAGYDPVTNKTWIMQDCELFELNPDGSSTSVFDVAALNPEPIFSCWGFTTIGDGTGYLSGRIDSDDNTSNEIFRVSLTSGEFIGASVPVDSTSSTLDPGTGLQINDRKLEPTELAYNQTTGDLWVAGYEGYIYRFDPVTGAISNIFGGLVTSAQWTWGMAVDSNNVLWMSVGDQSTWTELVALQPENGWARYHFTNAVVAGTTTPFDSDAMWITGYRAAPTQLANTGSTAAQGWVFSAATLCLGVAILIATIIRVRSRLSARKGVK